MELRRYWLVIAKWFWLIALSTVLAATVSYLVNRSTAPVYRASATLLVNQGRNPVASDYTAGILADRISRTHVELMKKRPILEKVVQELDLKVPPEQVAGMITVKVVAETQLIELSVEHTSPALARDIANTLADVFNEQNREERLGQTTSSRELLRQQIADLESDLRTTSQALERQRASGDGQSTEALRLQTVLSQQQLIYTQLLRSEQEMRLTEGRALDSVRTVEPAILPTRPVRPDVPQGTVLGAFVGLLIGVGVAFLIEYLDDTVKTSEDVQEVARLVTLGAILRMPSTNGTTSKLLHGVHSHSPIAEAYRILRTNVDFAQVGRPAKTLLVTSPNAREGKTTTLANLAIVMAEAGRRVVAVDADLRRPTLHKIFGLANGVGVTSLLVAEKPEIDLALQPTSVPNLRVMPSGPIPANPSELLGSERMAQLLERLRDEADLILLDSPPVLAVADPTVLGARVDGVVLIVDAGVTRAETLARAKETLTRGSARLLGVVLNKLTSRSGGYYYYYYYHHHYYSSDGPSADTRAPGDPSVSGNGPRPGWLESVRRVITR